MYKLELPEQLDYNLDFGETWPEYSSDISAEFDVLMKLEIFFLCDFPKYDNNSSIF